MTSSVTQYINVANKMAELGCQNPSSGIALLPVNFAEASSATELLQASDTATVRKLLKEAGVPLDEILERSQRPPYIKNKSVDWVAPILFLSAAFYSQNSLAVSVALSVIGNYATDLLKAAGRREEHVRLEIVVETEETKTFKKVSYNGPADGIKDLAETIRTAFHD